MWLVLCDSGDVSAAWACQGLRARGLAPLELVTTQQLAPGAAWEHRIGRDGVSGALRLPDGRSFSTDGVRGVLNRVLGPDPACTLLIEPGERPYIMQELVSFYLSWLSALPGPLINYPNPFGLCGQWRHISEWLCLAARAGLPTPPYRLTPHDLDNVFGSVTQVGPPGWPVYSVIALDGRVPGAGLPPDIEAGCGRLGALAGTRLLGVDLARSPAGEWTFAGANVCPDLRLGGEPLLDALAVALADGRGGGA